MIVAQAAASAGCLHRFAPFTLMHLATVAACVAAMACSCRLGRSWRGTPRERRFRHAWGWSILAYKLAETSWYNWPGNFDLAESLPLQLCDLAAPVAAMAMLTQRRFWRTMLYFWGLGLSTQGFLTPVVQTGLASLKFWMFWVSHTMIVGSAAYDLAVLRYRPRWRDACVAAGTSIAYALAATGVNLAFDVNYGYIGRSKPENPTIIDKLGPWPGRAFIVGGIVIADIVVLWAPWAFIRRCRTPEPPASSGTLG